MEAETALVRPQGGIELHPISSVDLYLVVIVFPHHAELDHSFRYGHHAEGGLVFGMLFKEGGAFEGVYELCFMTRGFF